MAATKYTGTRNGDRLTARTSGDTLEGQAGNDLLSSGTTLLSGVYLLGGEGNDTLVAKSSDALIDRIMKQVPPPARPLAPEQRAA